MSVRTTPWDGMETPDFYSDNFEIRRKYNNSKYYYMFLEDIKYAKDKEYINKVKKIAEELE